MKKKIKKSSQKKTKLRTKRKTKKAVQKKKHAEKKIGKKVEKTKKPALPAVWSLSEAREELLKLKKEIMDVVLFRNADDSSISKEELFDETDHLLEEKQKELSLMLNERERVKLHEIDDALRRIDNKSYGICEECGIDIETGRLKLIPYVKFCVDCQEMLEKENNYDRSVAREEDRIISPPSLTDPDEEES